ncbi:MAG: MFS transporter [Caldilineaceae bacterium]|nr:MFS transporter [Caldilineaceae bacterium]
MNDYISLIRRNVNYRNLWLARVVSNLGDWFNLLASAALITQLTGAGTAISYLFLARVLPIFVMSPFAGVLADRYERRAIMIVTDILRAITVLGFLLIRRPEQIWLLYALTVLQFVLSSLYTPAHSALLSNIVEPKDLVTANALDGFTWSTMLAFGALLGGIAAALFGLTTAFVLDALTFLVAAWFVGRIQVTRSVTLLTSTEENQGGLFQFVAGLGYLRARPFVLGLALAKAGGALAWGAVNVMEIPLAQDIFPINGNGTLTLGLVYAATGLGTGLGPLMVRRWVGAQHRTQLWAILGGLVALSAGILGLGFAPSLGWVLGASFLRSLGSGTIWVFSAAILQAVVDDEYRGRVFAFEFAALTLAQSISTLWAGVALDQLQLSVQDVLRWTALISLAACLLWAWFQTRTKTRLAVVAQA